MIAVTINCRILNVHCDGCAIQSGDLDTMAYDAVLVYGNLNIIKLYIRGRSIFWFEIKALEQSHQMLVEATPEKQDNYNAQNENHCGPDNFYVVFIIIFVHHDPPLILNNLTQI